MDTNLNNYVSVKEIIDGLMHYPSMRDLQYDSAIKWTVDIMGLIGSYDLYKDERDLVEIHSHRGKLPSGVVRVDQVRKVSGSYPNIRYDAMQYASDAFQVAYDKYPSTYTKATQEYTYKLQGDYIYTSFGEALIEVVYKTLYTDDDGIIMVPTNTSLSKAIEAYIKQEHFRGLFEIDKISKAVFEEAKIEYCWYVAQAQNSIMNVSLDERQSISNAIHRIMLNDDFHYRGFQNLSDQEQSRNIR
jgi:hypothetical protein